MKLRLPNSIYLVVIFGLVLVVAFSLVSFIRRADNQKSHTSETEALILKTDVRRGNDPETGKEITVDTIVTYEYEVAGKRYERTTLMNRPRASLFVPWKNGKVCYDPNDPKTLEVGELFPPGHICGN
jgi:hypothetical protein